MASPRVYTLDWSGKRLDELIAAVSIPDEDFCRELGLTAKGLARWREQGVPKKYFKRVAKLLGWNLVYPDFRKAPIGDWVKKQKALAEQPKPAVAESFRIAEPEEIPSAVVGFKEMVEATIGAQVKVMIEDVKSQLVVRQSLEDLASQQIVATPTLEQKPRKHVGFRND